MFNISKFITDISNLGKTRKFWVGLVGALINAAIVYTSSIQSLAPIVPVMTALGVYLMPNESK